MDELSLCTNLALDPLAFWLTQSEVDSVDRKYFVVPFESLVILFGLLFLQQMFNLSRTASGHA